MKLISSLSSIFNSNLNFGFLSNRVSRLLIKTVDQVAHNKNVEVPIHEMGILSDLNVKEGVLQQELAESLIRNKSSITKMLERLEVGGYIRKEANKLDGRGKRIYLTKKGKQMSDFMTKVLPEVHSIALNGLEKEEMLIGLKVMNKIYNNLIHYNSELNE